MIDFVFERLLPALLALLCLSLVGMLAVMAFEGVNEYRAQSATIACQQRQMDARRLYLSDSVVCVPVPLRRDTLYVETGK